jgi:hypothetical protein
MNKVQQTAAAAKKFVVRHKTAVAVVATASVCVALNRVALQQHNDFLKEHDLYDEFYASEEY